MPSGIESIAEIARRLGPLRQQFVFLGGAATGLLITDPAAPEMRPTDDVDVVVEVASRNQYYQLQEKLRALGFSQSAVDDGPLCRWRADGIIVDVMPTDENILGFNNRWYVSAIENAVVIPLEDVEIRVITAPYFLATKMEAFTGRGGGDYLTSHDMEDIVTLVNGRAELVLEVAAAERTVREFIAASFREYRASEMFEEAVAGHMLPDPISQARVPLVLERINRMREAAERE